MKKNTYTTYYLSSIGIVLYSLSILATPTEVRAETPPVPALTPEATSPPNTVAISTTDHQQAIQNAQKAGVEVIEVGYKQVPSKEVAEKEIEAQTNYIQSTTREYIAANQAYQTEAPHYQAYLKEQETFQKDSLEYAQYEAQERQYQSELAHYQEQEKRYKKELKEYEEAQATNRLLQETFDQEQEQYEKDQSRYQESLAHYEAVKKEAALIAADYQRKVENYHIEKMRYDKAKQAYDTEVTEAEKQTKTDGYLSQVSAQYLISRSEPNARVSFEGVTTFIASSHQFGNTLSGIGGKAADLPVSDTATLFRGVGAATAAKAGDGYGLILEKGKPITVIYSGLEQTSYDGQKIAQLVYTYELTSTFADDNRATVFIYTDPTKTIYTGASGHNKGLVDFNIRQTMTYYLENGEAVQFREDAPALLSFASRNNTFEFGEQEYVRLHKGMTFIPISGSSVTGEEGYVAARGSNNTIADGSRFNRGDWDNDGHPNEYYGAGVARVIGNTISFDFGIRYSQDNINRSHHPLHFRQASRQWFSVNADIKAKGVINSKPGHPPVLPQEPTLPSLPLKPTAPLRPTPPVYRSLRQPVPPVKPVRTHTIISKKPIRPQEVKQPSLPPIPIIFIKRIVYPTINIRYGTQYSPPPLQGGKAKASRIALPSSYSPIGTRHYSIPDLAIVHYPSIAPAPPARQHAHPLVSPRQASSASPTVRKNPINHGSPALMEKEAKDSWFSENTGIRGGDKDLFFQFIDELEKEARAKYGNDLAKINQYIANGIAYKNYGREGLQPKVADVGKEPKNKDALKLIDRIHQFDRFKIDFPHLAAPIATASQSSLKKEALKTVLGLNFGMAFGVLPSDVFFQANSWLGDTLTTMNDKDKITDKDAFIIHTLFPNLPLNEAIKRYYSIPDLDKKREGFYQGALKIKYPTSPNPELLLKASALLSTATIGLIAVFHILSPMKKKWEEFKEGWNKFKGKLKDYWEKFSKQQGQQKPGEKAPTHKSDKKPSPRLTSSKQAQEKITKPANRFSLIARTFNPKNILIPVKQAIQKKIVQPIKQAVTPIATALQKKVVQPMKTAIKQIGKAIQKKIVQPVKQAVRPLAKTIQKKVIQPVKQRVTPIAKAIQKKIVQPAQHTIKKTGNLIQKKVVQPVKRATKPIAKTIQKRVVQPVKKAIRKVTAPIQRKIIRPVRQTRRPVRRPIQRKAPKPIQRAKAPQRPIRKPARKKGR